MNGKLLERLSWIRGLHFKRKQQVHREQGH